MAGTYKLGVVSDIHYASAAEIARGDDYELRGIRNPLLRLLVRAYRRFIWLHRPLRHNDLLDRFLEQTRSLDFVVANGDYSCNSAFVGVSDPAAGQSAQECLGKLRAQFGSNMQAVFGDHELGKVSFFGGQGGMRIASWHAARDMLQLRPFWQVDLGRYTLIGVVSSLVALPVFRADTLPAEWNEWEQLRDEHLEQIRKAFNALPAKQQLLLFCHDPTALPFLLREPAVRARLPQIQQTIIGHLHSGLVLWKSRRLSGMPVLSFLGHTARRLSMALNEARHWRPFHLRLCPSLAGIELLKDGGYLTAELDLEGGQPAKFDRHHLPRS